MKQVAAKGLSFGDITKELGAMWKVLEGLLSLSGVPFRARWVLTILVSGSQERGEAAI